MKTFISSTAYKATTIKEAVIGLHAMGFDMIELSGGTQWYPELKKDLFEISKRENISLLLHNYFPPPQEPFVLNLASLNKNIYKSSLTHVEQSIILSSELGADRYGIHAGYYKDLKVDEVGKPVIKTPLNDREACHDRFYESYTKLARFAKDCGVRLYLENNVQAISNREAFGDNIPTMLVTPDDYLELKRDIDFPLLLDIAHLYVSCNTLEINFENAITQLSQESNYWHISDNDGKYDTNQPFQAGSAIIKSLEEISSVPETMTLEVYATETELKKSMTDVITAINK